MSLSHIIDKDKLNSFAQQAIPPIKTAVGQLGTALGALSDEIDGIENGLGTAASKDVPSSGDAGATEVVMGNDSRLTDARTPTAHAHDDRYYTESEIDEILNAKMNYSNPVGFGSLSIGRKANTTLGPNSHAVGQDVSATATAAHAEGQGTTASATAAHSEGRQTTASADYSHAEGRNTLASNFCSHAEGRNTVASGANSHAGGYFTEASGDYSTAIGKANDYQTGDLFEIGNGVVESGTVISRSNAFRVTANGQVYDGSGNKISDVAGKMDSIDPVGSGSFSMNGCYPVGRRSTAIGQDTEARGVNSFACGRENVAYNNNSVAIGQFNSVMGDNDLFTVGNGTSSENVSTAFTVDKLGDTYTQRNINAGGDIFDGYGNSTKQMGEDIFIIKNRLATVFTFHVDETESDPSEMITYKHDAVGMSPAYMDYTNSQFVYNGWDDVWFLKNLKPMIINLDGSVDTFLSPTNTSLNIDGNAVNHSAKLDGTKQYMIQFPEIYTRITPSYDGHSADISVSDVKVNDDFKCWSYYNKDGLLVPHFYYPMFKGSIVNNKLVSIPQMTGASGICKNKTASEKRNLAQANGIGWDTVLASDRQLINILLMLIGKSTNTQAVFGNGIIEGDETAFNSYTTGELLGKGLFYGYNDNTHSVKVLGIENYWSLQWDRCLGDILLNGDRKYKACYGYEDGSTVADFNFTGEGYPSMGVTQFSANGNYISQMKFNEKGMFASAASGSNNTYYADGMWINNGITAFAFFGGDSRNGLVCGASAVDLHCGAGDTWWDVGASPSYR